MLVVKSGQDQEKAQVESSSQGNQLFPTLEGQDTKVSTLKHRAPSPDGSPEAKKARMGSIKQLSTCSQSVAERLKESTQKLQEKPTSQNGATVPSVTEVKSPYSAFTGQKDLNEEQLNQVRVIAQHLKELGLREAVNALVEETGCKIEHTYASQIRKCIKTGNWKEALSYLDKSSVFIDTRQYEGARRELVLHKILGLLDEGQKIECIQLMREEHSRYHKCREFRELRTLPFLHPDRLKKAPVMITYRTPGYFDQVARSVEAVLPSNFMLQESRLDDLFSKAVKHQIEHCPHHMITKVNSNDTAENILRDHVCEKNKNEIHDGQKILTHEVLRSEFSPNGKYFIAASTTRHISLYKCAKKTGTLEHLRNFKPKPNYKSMRVTDMSWSWDSKLVAICGSTRINLEPLKVTVYETETGKIHRTIIKRMSQSRDTPNIDYSTLCFSWGSYKLAVADENGHFQVFDVTDSIEKENPPNVCNWEGLRLKRIHSLKSGALLCLDTHNRIRKYCMNPKTDDTVVREFLSVNNFIVHNSEKYVLTNTELNMHLWDITERSLVRTYRTFPSKDAIIDCAFGGPFEEYFATGTPDGRIFVYNINETEPLLQIKGHLRYINSVAWHPKSGMIATSGSDSVIRVWHLGCDLKDCTALPVKAAPVTSRKKIRKAKENAKKIAEKETVERNAERKMKAYESGAEERESQRLQEVAKKFECSPNSITASLAPLGRKDLAITLAPPKKTGIETSKIKKKRRRSNKEGDSISLPLENGVDEQKKSNRKRKRRRTKKSHDDESMEVDDSSIGKAAPSGSENGSVHSHL